MAIGNGDQQPLGILALPAGQLPTRAPVDNGVNGWWERDTETTVNEGLILQPLPAENRLAGTIYTYDNGDSRWFTFDSCSPEPGESPCLNSGAFDGIEAEGTIYEATGNDFNGTEGADVNTAGVFEVEFTGCTTGNILVALDDRDPVTWEIKQFAINTPCTLDDTLADETAE